MNDISQEIVDKGMDAISKSLDRMVKKEKISAGKKDNRKAPLHFNSARSPFIKCRICNMKRHLNW